MASVLALLSEEATNNNFIVFGLIDRDSNPRSTTLKVSTLIITTLMQIYLEEISKFIILTIYK
jgi:ribosome biogenesis SPOUT family RNA methylase Rps3